MMAFTYLLVNFFTIIISFIFSFHKKINFYRFFKPFIYASIIVAIPFIIWDIIFTKIGVWWFNRDYTIGVNFFGLPVEEWLFFICIPFACIFTYFCFNKFFDLNWTNKLTNVIAIFLIALCVIFAIKYHDRLYPLITSIITAITLFFLRFIFKVNWIGKGTVVYLVLMFGFLPVNGILTGTGLASPIVNYNPEEILNLRLLSIPIEDVFYGYSLFMLNIFFFNFFISKNNSLEKI